MANCHSLVTRIVTEVSCFIDFSGVRLMIDLYPYMMSDVIIQGGASSGYATWCSDVAVYYHYTGYLRYLCI